jgi:hypothetical protein
MLKYADLTPNSSDVVLLADDLRLIADEFGPDVDTEHDANHAVHVLRHRIGGYANLESYMRSLRAGKKAQS